MLKKFLHLGKGLAFVLAFIGVKLFLQAGHKVISTSIPEIPSLVSLAVIIIALTVSIVASLRNPLPPEDGEDAVLPTITDYPPVKDGSSGDSPATGSVTGSAVKDAPPARLTKSIAGDGPRLVAAADIGSTDRPDPTDEGDPAKETGSPK